MNRVVAKKFDDSLAVRFSKEEIEFIESTYKNKIKTPKELKDAILNVFLGVSERAEYNEDDDYIACQVFCGNKELEEMLKFIEKEVFND